MKCTNETVRRQDRLLAEEDALMLLREGEYGVLSLVEEGATGISGYGIPLNYVWDGEDALYFHCAPEGHKLECLEENANVSFCVVGQTQVISHKFTTAYASVLVRGTIAMDLPEAERREALIRIVEKYSPRDKEVGLTYVEKSFHRTQVLRLDLREISAKTKCV